jgi:GAF domain-containing protein
VEAKQQLQSKKQQNSQLEELVKITTVLTSSLEFDTVLEEVMDTVIRLTGAERAYLMLRHPGSNELRMQVARNWAQENLADEEATFSQGIIQAALEAGEPVITTNAQSDERFEARESVMKLSLRSIVVIPLLLKEEIIGVLYADNRIEQGLFGKENLPILSAFANQAAIAISNARLFEQVKDDLAEARKQVEELQIQIDEQRVEREVADITENEFFQQLSEKAAQLKEKRRRESDQ